MSRAPSRSAQQSFAVLRRVFQRFWPHIRQQRPLIGGGVLALIAETCLRLLEPWPLKFIFDQVLLSDGSSLSPVAIADHWQLIALAALAVVATTGLRALAAYLSTTSFALLSNRVLMQVREELYRHLQRLSLRFHHQARGGDLTVRVGSDINVLTDVTITAVIPLIADVLIMIGMLIVMLWIDWRLSLVTILVGAVIVWVTQRATPRIHAAARQQRQGEGAAAATAAESLGAIRVVQALALEEHFTRIFARHTSLSSCEGVSATRLSAGLERSVDLLIACATALVLAWGATLVVAGSLTPGELLVFLTYLKRAFSPVQDVAKYTGRLAKAAAAGERVLELLDHQPEVADRPNAVRAHPFQGHVAFEGVSFGYEATKPILRQVSFSVAPGQFVALVGPSGNGKSTIANLLMRLYDPSGGRILIDWLDVRRYRLNSLRSQISAVMQDTLLFAASVRENIAYGANNVTDQQIEAAARLANAHEFIQALPQGYETILGERGSTLSHGQRQRIAIARAAVRSAPILLLDEPTTGLDRTNERLVFQALERLAAGRTTFLITHDLHQAAKADLILFIEDGQIAESGCHADLLQRQGRYAALFRNHTAALDPQSERILHGEPTYAFGR
ncbi:MAG: ABC transporter ATP-binding protein [Roseiflexaceae bacterium]